MVPAEAIRPRHPRLQLRTLRRPPHRTWLRPRRPRRISRRRIWLLRRLLTRLHRTWPHRISRGPHRALHMSRCLARRSRTCIRRILRNGRRFGQARQGGLSRSMVLVPAAPQAVDHHWQLMRNTGSCTKPHRQHHRVNNKFMHNNLDRRKPVGMQACGNRHYPRMVQLGRIMVPRARRQPTYRRSRATQHNPRRG